jgi:hypothetical protein
VKKLVSKFSDKCNLYSYVEEQARSWLGTSPPTRAANPVSNDCRFINPRRVEGDAYGGNPGGGCWNHF